MNRILGNCTLRGTSKIQWGLKPYSTVRHFSSADGKSKEEMEEELYKLQRKSVLFYNKLNYKSALDFAIRGQDLTEKYMGKKNRIYASAVSNVALMV
jgi:adenine specific DNA methylase Mod